MQISGSVDPGFEIVRDQFRKNFDEGNEIGAALCVHVKGRRVLDLWGGIADPVEDRPWTGQTLQMIYSGTKPVLASCIHLLAQRNLIHLDANVAEYWPEFGATGKKEITIRSLLCHKAGLPVVDRTFDLSDLIAREPVISALERQQPAWRPDSKHGYHPMTYGWLLDEVVRRVTGRGIGQFFSEEFAGPLGLDFHIGLPGDSRDRVSRSVEASEDKNRTAGNLDKFPSILSEMFEEYLREYARPDSLTRRAFNMTKTPLDFNDPLVQAAELPSTNGFTTARSLSGIYSSLIGPLNGVQILTSETMEIATEEHTNGVDEILRWRTRGALGFDLPQPLAPWGSPSSFGFRGHGGSLAYACPQTGVSFAYVMNRLVTPMQRGIWDDRASQLARAVNTALEKL